MRHTLQLNPLPFLSDFVQLSYQHSLGSRLSALVCVGVGFAAQPKVYAPVGAALPSQHYTATGSGTDMQGGSAEVHVRAYLLGQAQRGIYVGGWVRALGTQGALWLQQTGPTPPIPDGRYTLASLHLGPLVGYQAIRGRLVLDAAMGLGLGRTQLRTQGTTAGYYYLPRHLWFWMPGPLALYTHVGIGLVLPSRIRPAQ